MTYNTVYLTKLAEIREQFLISVRELSRISGLSPLTILKIEKGRSCRIVTARRIIQAICSLSGLCGATDDTSVSGEPFNLILGKIGLEQRELSR